ncbi:hypothetical protein B0A48_02176 [Cryoendolithus antarcticus]|uniref:Heterokaryon incompatibility domain-containing protein n=1 Tax=Cryoendolithus antarcticus TaxID=1507870 RepID=A0A1V8TNC8_9PEZI|nr:hypothetical protein B0A48_02176 [Cryoendolithus antarcticus]
MFPFAVDHDGGAEEKNQQVAFMGKIYEHAEHVFVWLPLDQALKGGSSDRRHWDQWQDFRDWHREQIDQALLTEGPVALSTPRGQNENPITAWSNIHTIVKSAWWNRAWVYQEYMFARQVTFLIAEMSVPPEDLHQLLQHCVHRLPAYQYACAAILSAMKLQYQNSKILSDFRNFFAEERRACPKAARDKQRLRVMADQAETHRKARLQWDLATFVLQSRVDRDQHNQANYPLSRLMGHAGKCKSADPRDQVYAFLGLANPAYGLVADYRSTVTAKEVLTKAAMGIITVEKRLDLLAIGRDESGASSAYNDLPTWVPNWSRPQHHESDYKHFLREIAFPTATESNPRPCQATRDREPQVSFHPNSQGHADRILRAAGIRVATLGTPSGESGTSIALSFSATGSDLRIITCSPAKTGDEVWVLLGADEPFVLGKARGLDQEQRIVGHAMLRLNGRPSDIFQGSMIDLLNEGAVRLETVDIA